MSALVSHGADSAGRSATDAPRGKVGPTPGVALNSTDYTVVIRSQVIPR